MLKNLVPVTKLIGTIAFSFWALVFNTPGTLIGLVVAEVVIMAASAATSRLLPVSVFLPCFSALFSFSAAAPSNPLM